MFGDGVKRKNPTSPPGPLSIWRGGGENSLLKALSQGKGGGVRSIIFWVFFYPNFFY